MELSEILIVASIVCFYQFVFRWLSPKLCKWMIPSYKNFSQDDKIYMDSGNSNVCNTLVLMIFIVLSFNEGIIFEQPIWGKSGYVTGITRNALGYAISDLQIHSFHYTAVSSSRAIIFHHICFIMVLASQLYMDTFGYFGVLRLISEIVQPFLHFRGCMIRLGMKKSKLYVSNGLLLFVLYFLSRIMIIPLVWKPYLNEETSKYYRQYPENIIILFSVGVLFDILNIYWFSLIFKAVFSFLRKRKE